MKIAPPPLGVLGLVAATAVLAPADSISHHHGPPDLDGTYFLQLPPPAGDRTRAGSADLDGDGMLDAVSLSFSPSGWRLDVLFAPGIHEIVVPDISNPEGQGLEVMDFAVIVEPDGRDTLALVDESGLVLLDISTSEEGLLVTRNELGGFEGATSIDVWHDGQGNHYAAGLRADGSNIYRADDLEGPWKLRPTMPTWSPVAALDMALLDTSGRGEAPKVASIFGNFICYYDPWGGDSLDLKFYPGVSYRDMARYRRGGKADADGLALLAMYGGAPHIASICNDTLSSFQPLDPAEQFYSLSSGRYDTDDLDDLVLAGKGSEKLFVILDAASSAAETPSFTFDPEFFHAYDADPGTAAANTSQALLLDADGDGDGDLALPLNVQNLFWVGRNGTVDAAEFMATHDEGAFTPAGADPDDLPVGAHLYPTWADLDGDGVDDELEWWIVVDVTLPPSLPSPHLDVVTWKTPINQYYIHHEPVDSQRLDVSGLAGTRLQLTISADEPGEAFYEGVWLEQLYTIFQFVDADDLDARQSHCYPAQGIVFAPGIVDPPHAPVDIWAVTADSPPDAYLGGDPLPNGSGDDTDCVPAERPPLRR